MKAINIIWDVNCPEDLNNLPTEIDVPNNIKYDEDAISDYLSDKTGFCHKGFELRNTCGDCVHFHMDHQLNMSVCLCKDAPFQRHLLCEANNWSCVEFLG